MSNNRQILVVLNDLMRIVSILRKEKLSGELTCLAIEKELLKSKLEYLIKGPAEDDLSMRIRGLTSLGKKILDFIKTSGEVENLNVYKQFPNVSRRTLRRNIKYLIDSGHISKTTKGRDIFYRVF